MPNILIERNGPLTTFIINRPQVRNALDTPTARELGAALLAFDQDPEQKVGVITGAEGTFCAGGDLNEMADAADYIPWAGHPDGPCANLLSKPLIAAVEGYATAGGVGVALRCDIRIAGEGAIFGIFCRRWGVPMSDGTTVRLPRLIGQGRALHMLLTGEPVPAPKALEWGLITEMVPTGSARAAAEEMAIRIAAFPPIAMNSDRTSMYRTFSLDMDDALALETELAEQAKKQEAQSGAQRFRDGEGRHGKF